MKKDTTKVVKLKKITTEIENGKETEHLYPNKSLLGIITPWEVGPIPIAPQLCTDLGQGTAMWSIHGLGYRLSR